MRHRPPRSLKARALQLLAQREQSRAELRRKLLAFLRPDESHPAAAVSRAAAADAENTAGGAYDRASEDTGDTGDSDAADSQVEAVLDWLSAHGFASDERFAESRVHARSARYGNLRIRQELKQHGVALKPEVQQALAASEEARASTVCQRRFDGQPPASAAEAAKRARFLAGRGFSPDVIRRVLRAVAGSDTQ